ncbi:S-layer homology domain-containing protein [Dialister sp.]|uniref:S-layer homology domain-containing protein n=1 Tax=Dialister sp. TaxID=1955814 RepID=UPI002E814B09|nr:S-layer homology domain-containing protein [Dialister sp.]MEE3453588.1 S-layer homology domain-containing protein [Dialister sp.]
MKKILAIAACAALGLGVSAYAANPFSDVSTDDWAYQAVSDLSDQGVVEGYPDGTFKGEKNMTRYELAQIIARLMAKEDQLNAEQRATLDKLSGEYADELANLGVRVGNLEKKVGNITWFGDARMRYKEKYTKDADGKLTGDTTGVWDGRMRINVKAQVNDSTYVRGRLVQNMDFKAADDGSTSMNVLYVHHQFGDNASVDLGKSFLTLGQTALFVDDVLDGVQGTFGNSKLALNAGFGRINAWEADGFDGKDLAFARVIGKSGRFAYDAGYMTLTGKGDQGTWWGAGLTAGITDDLDVFGDYYQNTDAKGDPALWTAGIGYGHYAAKKPGTWRLTAQYVKDEKGAYRGAASTFTAFPLNVTENKYDTHFWLVNGDVMLAKNVRLHGEYAFDVSTNSDVDLDDTFTVSLNYNF